MGSLGVRFVSKKWSIDRQILLINILECPPPPNYGLVNNTVNLINLFFLNRSGIRVKLELISARKQYQLRRPKTYSGTYTPPTHPHTYTHTPPNTNEQKGVCMKKIIL